MTDNTINTGFTSEGLTPEGEEVQAPKPVGFTSEGLSSKTEDDYVVDPAFIADAKTLAPFLNFMEKNKGASQYLASIQGKPIIGNNGPSLTEMEEGMAAAEEAYVPEDTDFSKGAMDAAGNVQWNWTRLGITAADVSNWPEEAQMALIRTMKTYDDVPFEKRHAWRAVKGVLSDPTTYIGFGIFAKAMSKVALKGGAATLLKSFMSKPVLTGTAVAATEGFVYTGADNAFRQAIDNQGDFSKVDITEVSKNAAIGGGVGFGIGYFLSKVLGPRASTRTTTEVTEGVEVSRLDGEGLPANASEELDALTNAPAVKDEPIQGELLDDGSGTGMTTTTKQGDTPVDGDVHSLDNAEAMPEASVGEDWMHMYEGRETFNTDRIETLDDVKAFVESASAHWEKKRLSDADMNPDGVETLASARIKADEEAQLLKEETGGDISEILEQYKDDHAELQKIRHRAQALRRLNVSLGERVLELAEKQQDGGGLLHEEAAEFIEKAALFTNTMELTKLASREFSRGLGNYRMIMKADPTLMEGLKTGQAAGDVGALAKTILSMTSAGKGKLNLKGMKKATDKMKDPTFLQELIRFRSAMMLSAPSTIEAAGLSNMAKLWTEPFVEWVGHLGRGSAKKKARMRAIAQYAGNRRFFFDSWKQAAKAWKNGQHITDPFVTKVENQTDKSLANMSWLRRNVWERGVHGAHLALLFLDEGIKSNRARSLIYAETFTEAVEKGIAPKGPEFEALLQHNLDAKIDQNGMLRDKEIMREIRETTYTSDLEGRVGTVINNLADLGGGWGRLIVVPFIRAPINIVSESMMYIPGSKMFSAKQQNIMKSGSSVAKAKLKARKQLGTAAVIGLWYAAEEEMITGSGPADYKLRADWKAMGYEPNSIRIGDQWVSYAKLGPVGLLMGLVADLNWITKKDLSGTNMSEAVTEVLAASVYAVTNNVLNKAYFSSVSGLMDGLQNPDTLGTEINSWFLSFTPNILNQMNSDLDVKEASSFMEKLQRRIPEWSESLGNQYDFYGRVITKPAHDIPFYGYMFKNREVVKDPVAEQIYKLGEGLDRAILNKPPYGLGVTNTDYRDVYDYGETESVYAKYNRTIGEMKDPVTGDTMYKALEHLMASSDYRHAPHSTEGDITPPKVKMIQAVVNDYRNMAKEKLHQSSHAFRQKQRERGDRIDSIFQ